jgi:tetratricopeptide (TPR) repeat protein
MHHRNSCVHFQGGGPDKGDEEIDYKVKMLMLMGRYLRAIEYLQDYDKIFQKQHLFFKLLTCYYLNGQFDSIIDAVRKWHEVNKTPPPELLSLAYEFVGTSLFVQKKYAEAIKAFDKAIEIDQSNTAIYSKDRAETKLNSAHTESGPADDAVEFTGSLPLASAIENEIGFEYALVPAVEIEYSKDTAVSVEESEALKLEQNIEFMKAVEVFKKVMRRKKLNSFQYGHIGLTALTVVRDEGSLKFAETVMDKSVESSNTDWRLLNNYGILKQRLKDFSQAYSTFKKCLKDPGVTGHSRLAMNNALKRCALLGVMQSNPRFSR